MPPFLSERSPEMKKTYLQIVVKNKSTIEGVVCPVVDYGIAQYEPS